MLNSKYNKIENFIKAFDYHFKDSRLLEIAFTHPSAIGKKKNCEFDRLEFLGDRVLGLLIASNIYAKFPKESEGDLAKRLAFLVSRKTCHDIAIEFGIDRFVVFKSENDIKKTSILANAIEALIGAIYIDGGLEESKKLVYKLWDKKINASKSPPKDSKSALQEFAQKKSLPNPEYKVISTSGTDHEPIFTIEVSIDGQFPKFTGIANNKKKAEQIAASNFLKNLK